MKQFWKILHGLHIEGGDEFNKIPSCHLSLYELLYKHYNVFIKVTLPGFQQVIRKEEYGSFA